MNKKIKNSSDRNDAKTVRVLVRQYQYYGFNRRFQFIAANCANNHFFVIHVVFDVQKPHIFEQAYVYDSIRRTGRRNDAVNRNSLGGNFLRQFQLFLSNYCFVGAPNNEILLGDSDFILRNAFSISCPQQNNLHDCALFAMATVLHKVNGDEISADTFSQCHIDSLRLGLHAVFGCLRSEDDDELPDPKQLLTSNFVCSFFPRLVSKINEGGDGAEGATCENDVFVQYVRQRKMQGGKSPRHVGVAVGCAQPSRPLHTSASFAPDNDSSWSSSSSRRSRSSSDSEQSASRSSSDSEQSASSSSVSSCLRTEDKLFSALFVDAAPVFDNLNQVDAAIDYYDEETSGLHIIVKKSEGGCARLYHCVSHVGCCFRAKFGKERGTNKIVFKIPTSVLYHSGEAMPEMAGGRRKRNKRWKGRLSRSIDTVVSFVKEAKPVPKDVMKAAANLDGRTTNYNQSFRALRDTTKMKHEQDILSFQLIGPYLKKFTDQNPESVVRLERDAGNHIERVFICHGIMKTTLRYVRPMVSLDAAHLWSKWGGTLYIASVLTGCNEIYPVAIAIMKENENNDGWEWFLNLLVHSSVDLLVMEHPRLRVRFKYFTFISDRQKGLTPALARVFPENHSCFCAIHIARNVEKKVGKKLAKNVYALSTTFSHREAAELLGGIARVSTTGREYLESIPPEQWRSTAWLDDQTLPPRFGIVTTNMSESANSMFEKSRDGSWLECLDTTLAKMVERISTLREKHRGKTGVICPMSTEVKG